jgi:hypothetical protein
VGAIWELWTTGLDSVRDAAITNFTVSLYYYPYMRGFVDAGLGISDYRVVKGQHNVFPFPTGESTSAAGTGVGVRIGIGYEFPHRGSVSFAPHVEYVHGIVGRLHDGSGGIVARGWKQNVVALTVQMNVH